METATPKETVAGDKCDCRWYWLSAAAGTWEHADDCPHKPPEAGYKRMRCVRATNCVDGCLTLGKEYWVKPSRKGGCGVWETDNGEYQTKPGSQGVWAAWWMLNRFEKVADRAPAPAENPCREVVDRSVPGVRSPQVVPCANCAVDVKPGEGYFRIGRAEVFCCRPCAKAFAGSETKAEAAPCATCGKPVDAATGYADLGRPGLYCSKDCAEKAHAAPPPADVCGYCSKKIEGASPAVGGKRYCCDDCLCKATLKPAGEGAMNGLKSKTVLLKLSHDEYAEWLAHKDPDGTAYVGASPHTFFREKCIAVTVGHEKLPGTPEGATLPLWSLADWKKFSDIVKAGLVVVYEAGRPGGYTLNPPDSGTPAAGVETHAVLPEDVPPEPGYVRKVCRNHDSGGRLTRGKGYWVKRDCYLVTYTVWETDNGTVRSAGWHYSWFEPPAEPTAPPTPPALYTPVGLLPDGCAVVQCLHNADLEGWLTAGSWYVVEESGVGTAYRPLEWRGSWPTHAVLPGRARFGPPAFIQDGTLTGKKAVKVLLTGEQAAALPPWAARHYELLKVGRWGDDFLLDVRGDDFAPVQAGVVKVLTHDDWQGLLARRQRASLLCHSCDQDTPPADLYVQADGRGLCRGCLPKKD